MGAKTAQIMAMERNSKENLGPPRNVARSHLITAVGQLPCANSLSNVSPAPSGPGLAIALSSLTRF
jgi:hypothetical protein